MFDKYNIIKVLSINKNTKVYLGKHNKLQILRIIKCISKTCKEYTILKEEINILKGLKHFSIPIIYDIEEDNEWLYIIEEYFENNKSLDDFKPQSTILYFIYENKIISLIIQLCDLIQYLHSNNILYLDLKPSNIIIDKNENLKLIDFGTAIYKDEVHNRKYSIGTKGYASPEQYYNKDLNEKSDIYSIGMILYYAVTPYDINIYDCMENIDKISICSKKLKTIINKCLKYNSYFRYSSVLELKKDLIKLKKINSLNNINILKKHVKLNTHLVITVCGSMQRIGTTHTALLISSYINKNITPCIYIENNNSNIIRDMIDYSSNIKFENGVYNIENCPITSYENVNNRILDMYNIIIRDIGVINLDKIDKNTNILILILGTKIWEIEKSQTAVNIINNNQFSLKNCSVKYLFNYTNELNIKKTLKCFKIDNAIKIPYENNCFNSNDIRIKNFVKQLIKL